VTLTLVLAVWFFASGFVPLTGAVQLRGTPEAWMMGFRGTLSIILGLLIAKPAELRGLGDRPA
jgi:uncharacterized membrane protein HdeD (DUF308 family)